MVGCKIWLSKTSSKVSKFKIRAKLKGHFIDNSPNCHMVRTNSAMLTKPLRFEAILLPNCPLMLSTFTPKP